MSVVSDHVIAGLLHVQVLRDESQPDPQASFTVQIIGPGFKRTFPISNNTVEDFKLSGVHVGGIPTDPTIRLQVENFALVPPGSTATAIGFLLVFKLVEIFQITLGSVPVSCALR
ncbi:MAG: hypothetical protein EPN48_18390 [Microbacteriaceae bacterium]|nr:MAG: hypothetical protein EPN48_18390 [Microbacteriaceae bacterium]